MSFGRRAKLFAQDLAEAPARPAGDAEPAQKRQGNACLARKEERSPVSLLERINARPLPFAELIGVEFVSAEPDAVEARMVVRPYLCRLGALRTAARS